MSQLVSEQIATRSILLPLGEVSWPVYVFAGAMVLETDAAEILTEREQKIVAIERARAVEHICLFHQFAIGRELLRLDFQPGRVIRDQIEIHRDICTMIELHALIITAGKQRGVDQCIE